jgi:hypothetical protein
VSCVSARSRQVRRDRGGSASSEDEEDDEVEVEEVGDAVSAIALMAERHNRACSGHGGRWMGVGDKVREKMLIKCEYVRQCKV